MIVKDVLSLGGDRDGLFASRFPPSDRLTLGGGGVVLPSLLSTDVIFVPSSGQSDSIGAQANAADTAFSTSPVDGLLMFGPQMNQGIEFTGFTKLQTPIAAVESNAVGATNTNETPCRGFGEGLLKLMEKRAGQTYAQHGKQILLGSFGNGGESIQNLLKEVGRTFGDYTTVTTGSQGRNFALLEAAMAAAKTWADGQGLTIGCPALQFHWGADGYDSALPKQDAIDYHKQLADQLQAAVLTVFGQTSPCYLIIKQSHAHFARNTVDSLDMYIAEAQQLAAEQHANIILGAPQYMNLFRGGEAGAGSSVHHRPSGSKILGASNADRLYSVLVDGADEGDFLPSAITRVSSTLLKIDYDVPADWELCWRFQHDENEDLQADPQSGFWPVETGTTTALAIGWEATTGSKILPWIDGNSVYFQFAADMPATCDLTYGSGTYGGNLAMRPRCDAAAVPVVLQSKTANIYRHACLFRRAIP